MFQTKFLQVFLWKTSGKTLENNYLPSNTDKKSLTKIHFLFLSQAFFVSNVVFVRDHGSIILIQQLLRIAQSWFSNTDTHFTFETKNVNTDKKCKTFFVSKDSLFLSNIFCQCFKRSLTKICHLRLYFLKMELIMEKLSSCKITNLLLQEPLFVLLICLLY